ncbi:MAG: hypothetical protein PVJ49_17415, partial [Acidobacteriota bacterium]
PILGKLFALVVLVAIAYVAAVTIPVVISSFQFSQAMDTEVLYGPANEAAGMVHRRLVAQAEALGLRMSAEQIVVKKSGPRYEIDASYIVPIEFLGVTYNWQFNPHKEGVRRSTAYLR